jgi:exopolysaccharide production protein ExoZ
MTIESSKRYYPGVDLVRFVSALLVVFYHLGFGSWAKPHSEASRIVVQNFSMPVPGWIGVCGWVGVQIFFVVSGVVITQSANGRSPAAFAKGRFYRLYPAVWLCATITLLTALHYHTVDTPILAYFHSMVLFPDDPYVDWQYWTLPVEIFFYGLVFFLLAIKAFQHVEKLAISLVLLTTIYMASMISLQAAHRPLGDLLWRLNAHGLPFYYGCFFGLGTLITLRSRRSISAFGMAMLPLALIVCCWQVYDHFMRHIHEDMHFHWPMASYWPLPIAIFLVAVAVIAWSTTERLAVGDQGHRVIRALGLTTYPLYLIHLTNGAAVFAILRRFMVPEAAFVTTVLAMIALAMLIALVIEPRLRRVVRNMVDRLEVGRSKPAWLYSSGGVAIGSSTS